MNMFSLECTGIKSNLIFKNINKKAKVLVVLFVIAEICGRMSNKFGFLHFDSLKLACGQVEAERERYLYDYKCDGKNVENRSVQIFLSSQIDVY